MIGPYHMVSVERYANNSSVLFKLSADPSMTVFERDVWTGNDQFSYISHLPNALKMAV